MRLLSINMLLPNVALTVFVLTWAPSAQASLLLGDLNGDGLLSAADADLLTNDIYMANNPLSSDLNGDGVVGLADLDIWFAEYSIFSGVPLATAVVDINFDGINNLADYSILWGNFGAVTSNFTDGDLNADGSVGLFDLDLYKNRGGVVPEPTTLSTPLLGCLLAGRRRAGRR